jgi:hypothetical protein
MGPGLTELGHGGEGVEVHEGRGRSVGLLGEETALGSWRIFPNTLTNVRAPKKGIKNTVLKMSSAHDGLTHTRETHPQDKV